jgi:membrane protein implicated in regulation of membrane protease activity
MVKSMVFATLTFVLLALLIAALLFFPVMFLAGPHSSLLPTPLQTAIIILCWLAIIAVPAWLAVKVFRRYEAQLTIQQTAPADAKKRRG